MRSGSPGTAYVKCLAEAYWMTSPSGCYFLCAECVGAIGLTGEGEVLRDAAAQLAGWMANLKPRPVMLGLVAIEGGL